MLPYSTQCIEACDVEAVSAALKAPFLTKGPLVEAFACGLAQACTAESSGPRGGDPLGAVPVSSGTAALHLAYLALGMGPGRVGLAPAITFAATANAFLYTGAQVQLVDVDPVEGGMEPAHLQEVLDSIPKAQAGVVAPVSLGGRAGNLAQLAELARRYGFKVVEDAAHSLGGHYQTPGGTYSSASCVHTDAAILSFHPVKAICTGEGGAVLSRDPEVLSRADSLRTHGMVAPEAGALQAPWLLVQSDLGFHYRLTELQAALGLSQLNRLPEFIQARRKWADRYRAEIRRSPRLSSHLMLPSEDPGDACHLFRIHFQRPELRDPAHGYLAEQGIQTQVHYLPIYRHPYYRNHGHRGHLPGAEAYFASTLSLPLFPHLTSAQQDHVLSSLERFFERKA